MTEGPLDSVDRILAGWAVADPQLPVRTVGVVTRLARVRLRLDEELAGLFARFDLNSADFGVIAALRRTGPPHQLRQSVLMEQLGLTSGTVSTRLARLERKGVVVRRPSDDDARSAVVGLTAKGLAVFAEVGPAHLHNEDVLLSALTVDEQDQLARLLHTLLVGFEHERTTSPLGMTLAPAHVARRLRAAVGLSDTAGLLVTEVAAGSPAARAGLQEGDLLRAVDGVELRSCVVLAEHAVAAGHGRLTFDVLRLAEQLRIEVGDDR